MSDQLNSIMRAMQTNSNGGNASKKLFKKFWFHKKLNDIKSNHKTILFETDKEVPGWFSWLRSDS